MSTPIENNTTTLQSILDTVNNLPTSASTSIDHGTELPTTASDGDIFLLEETTPEVDFIVEQGTSGIWRYRKWNSGFAECWGYATHTAATNDFVSYQTDYPFAFTATPHVNVSAGPNGGWIKDRYPYLNSFSTTGTAITYRNATTDSVTTDLYISVTGTWK